MALNHADDDAWLYFLVDGDEDEFPWPLVIWFLSSFPMVWYERFGTMEPGLESEYHHHHRNCYVEHLLDMMDIWDQSYL